MSNSSVFKLRLKVLRSSTDLQLHDSEFQTEGALTLNAFADTASAIRATVSNNLSDNDDIVGNDKKRLGIWNLHQQQTHPASPKISSKSLSIPGHGPRSVLKTPRSGHLTRSPLKSKWLFLRPLGPDSLRSPWVRRCLLGWLGQCGDSDDQQSGALPQFSSSWLWARSAGLCWKTG